MKTKYWKFFVFAGVLLALSIGSQIGNKHLESDPYVSPFFIAFAIIHVGFGLKLRKMNKKGNKNTN